MAVTYTPTTNFGAKDSLPSNDPSKVIKGSEFTTEFTALQTAFSLAAPNASPTFTGTVTIPTADINGGTVDGTTIGGTTPAAATFTSVTATTADINGGNIDGTVIGGATPAAGSFTTVTADGLTVAGDIRTDNASYIVQETSTGGAVRMLGINAGNSAYIGPIDSGPTDAIFNASSTSNTSAFYTAGAERMRIDSAGNVGIGTSLPDTLLNLESAAPTVRLAPTTQNNATSLELGVLNAGTTAYAKIDAVNLSTYDTNLRFFTNTSSSTTQVERMRIDSGGNLLVGTTGQIGVEKFGVDSGSGAAGKFKGGSNTNVTVDAWNPATSGDNIFVAFRTETAETTRGTITYNRAGGLVVYSTTSDYRAKDIIGPVQNTGATIDALKVYEGKMKGATQSRPMLVAHEAQEHTPYAVSGVKDEMNEDGTPKFQQIDVSSLVPLLIAEIQSLRARVAQLEGA